MAIILKDKQAKILIMLKTVQQPWYLSSLAQACGATYVHTSNFIKECERLGLTTNEKHGKIKEIKLTEKGSQIADSLSNIYNLINQQGQPQPKPEPSKEQKPQQPPPEKK